jgi:hypothetical protein
MVCNFVDSFAARSIVCEQRGDSRVDSKIGLRTSRLLAICPALAGRLFPRLSQRAGYFAVQLPPLAVRILLASLAAMMMV